MKYLLLLIIQFSVFADEYQFNIGRSYVEHSWRGPDNTATYKPTMSSVGLAYIRDGLGVSVSYGKLNDSSTTGKYSDLSLEMNYIVSLEVTYRYAIDDFVLFAGLGTYIIPASVRSKTSDYYDHDYDNDEGYLLGFDYKISDSFSIRYKFTHQSRVKVRPYDEWTKSHGIHLVYIF